MGAVKIPDQVGDDGKGARDDGKGGLVLGGGLVGE